MDTIHLSLIFLCNYIYHNNYDYVVLCFWEGIPFLKYSLLLLLLVSVILGPFLVYTNITPKYFLNLVRVNELATL